MRWIIWSAGAILVDITFEPTTLAFYVSAGLVFIVGSTMSGWGGASTAGPGVRVAKD